MMMLPLLRRAEPPIISLSPRILPWHASTCSVGQWGGVSGTSEWRRRSAHPSRLAHLRSNGNTRLAEKIAFDRHHCGLRIGGKVVRFSRVVAAADGDVHCAICAAVTTTKRRGRRERGGRARLQTDGSQSNQRPPSCPILVFLSHRTSDASESRAATASN